MCNTCVTLNFPDTGPRYLWEVADGGEDERSTKASPAVGPSTVPI